MFILIVLALCLVIALARGGRVSRVLELRTRHLWILFIPFALQLIAFSPLGDAPVSGALLAKALYVSSLAVAALAVWLNRHLPGLTLISLGLALNFVVIALNGGFMPVSLEARRLAGRASLIERDANVIPMTPDTVLPWLGDVLPLPAGVPFANVFSIGDVLITLGGIIFIWRALVPRRL